VKLLVRDRQRVTATEDDLLDAALCSYIGECLLPLSPTGGIGPIVEMAPETVTAMDRAMLRGG